MARRVRLLSSSQPLSVSTSLRAGEVLKCWPSALAAAAAFGHSSAGNITSVLRGKGASSGGFGWRFEPSAWACCDACDAWRRLARGARAPAEDAPWTCADAGRADCACGAPPDELSSSESVVNSDGPDDDDDDDNGPKGDAPLPPIEQVCSLESTH